MALIGARVSGGRGELETAIAELEAAQRELDRFAADPTAAELLGQTAWAAGMRARAERVEAAQTSYREHSDREHEAMAAVPVEVLDSLHPYQFPPTGQSPLPAIVQVRVTTPSALPAMVNLSPLAEPAFAVTVKVVAVPAAALR
jgi:hypothetical protein